MTRVAAIAVLVALAGAASATPKPGDYSNTEPGTLRDAGEASCAKKLGADGRAYLERVRKLFTSTIVRVTKGELRVLDSLGDRQHDAGSAVAHEYRTKDAVGGRVDLDEKILGGHLWLDVTVSDPDAEYPNVDSITVGLMVYGDDGDGDLKCGDAVRGGAMRQDLPKPAPKRPPAKK